MVAIEMLWKTPEAQTAKTRETPNGIIIEGQLYHAAPLNTRPILDFTTPPGTGSGIFLGFLFYLSKWRYHIVKIEESMEISPVHAKYYEITIRQKQTLERQIKEGLAGITTAIADFELLFHDLRKYNEFLEYYQKIEEGKREKKPELVMKGEQSLKAIFIDIVDVHTGEGIALKLIAPRWPTIIADFMRLTDKDIEPKKIAEKYKVSEAEGVVLATKNKLYMAWREMFRATVAERYERLFGMVKARKKSIDEYRNMLRPYITRYRSIRELGETAGGRRALEKVSWFRPGAQAVSVDVSTIWAFKAYHPPEIGKVAPEAIVGKKDVRRMPFPREFKEVIRKNYNKIKDVEYAPGEKLGKVSLAPSGIEPLDKWVLIFLPYIEKAYGIKLTPVHVLEAREQLVNTDPNIGLCGKFGWSDPYFRALETTMFRTAMRMPDGTEMEDLWFEPFRVYLDTQNIILLRMLELKAKELELERYITEMLGETTKGKKIEELKKEYGELFEVFPKPAEKPKVKKFDIGRTLKKMGLNIWLIKPGPYETNFEDRITGPWFEELADVLFKPAVTYLKGSFGVPGFIVPGH